MAWMKSTSTGHWYLTSEFTQRKITDQAEANGVTAVLGFPSSPCDSPTILAELARVEGNRAALVKDIADAVLAGVAVGAGAAPAVDYERIARDVEASLVDEFAAVNANIDDQPTEFKIVPDA